MSVERPTFSESWHRVADLHPRLRPSVRVVRQRFRHRLWHVVQDEASDQFFRLDDAAYAFVGLLNGRRTVGEAWRLVNERLGDEAPTQPEAVRLLGQLYSGNLLQAEMAGDTQALLKRHRRRVGRQVRSYLANLLFMRFPLWDPDAFLERWISLAGWLFSPIGVVLWLVIVGVGAVHLLPRMDDLLARPLSGAIALDNLAWLYLTFAMLKLFHEFGHAFACKAFGRVVDERGRARGGEVHVMGLMLLVLAPLPYMDASSSWTLRSRRQRIVVAAAGMLVELALAGIAAIVWARSAEGELAHDLAYNVIFAAGASTILFNANPLLRYDGYYILADAIDIPNLAQRSRDYTFYLIKSRVWKVRNLESPADAPRERPWLGAYWLASSIYRVFVYAAILLFIAQEYPIVGLLLAVPMLVGWLAWPAARFVRYLIASPELSRVRGRAVATTALAAGVLALFVGLIPMPDRVRAEGVVEPRVMAPVTARMDGFVTRVASSGEMILPEGVPVLVSADPALLAQERKLSAERTRLVTLHRAALATDRSAAQAYARQLAVVEDQLAWARERLADLEVRAPVEGMLVAPGIERLVGAHVSKGDLLGRAVRLDQLVVRATATQPIAARLDRMPMPGVEVRAKARPDLAAKGVIEQIAPAGDDRLPSAALALHAGGPHATRPSDPRGETAAEAFFGVKIALPDDVEFFPGQRVVVRFTLPPRPLAQQAWHRLLQVFQERLRM